jgi:hypothetical protein
MLHYVQIFLHVLLHNFETNSKKHKNHKASNKLNIK